VRSSRVKSRLLAVACIGAAVGIVAAGDVLRPQNTKTVEIGALVAVVTIVVLGAGVPIAFGHWSTLGLIDRPDLLSLDTGCVWGGSLTAVRIDGGRRELFQVQCRPTP